MMFDDLLEAFDPEIRAQVRAEHERQEALRAQRRRDYQAPPPPFFRWELRSKDYWVGRASNDRYIALKRVDGGWVVYLQHDFRSRVFTTLYGAKVAAAREYPVLLRRRFRAHVDGLMQRDVN